MKIILIVLASVSILCGIVSCDGLMDSFRETFSKETVVGGYTKQRRLSDEEKLLFESVAQEVAGVKYTPMNVSTQVVAGTNYRFLCKGKSPERGGEKFYAVITIHKPLPQQGEPRIISIERQVR